MSAPPAPQPHSSGDDPALPSEDMISLESDTPTTNGANSSPESNLVGQSQADRGRYHAVLVPGFGGFDALGQILYYTGVTDAFHDWRAPGQPGVSNPARRSRLELHYFDNLPTAAVRTRATRLKHYLAKRLARRSFQDNDKLTLVGHSTGGLDIRKLLYDLARSPHENTVVDGNTSVENREILKMVTHIVFLSVPQYGTNIADWVKSHDWERTILFNSFSTFGTTIMESLPDSTLDPLGVLIAPNLLAALKDAARECYIPLAGDDPVKRANAREAASEINLWVKNIDEDFVAIDDLSNYDNNQSTYNGVEGDSLDELPFRSPAHFRDTARLSEKNYWKRYNITTMSFATLGTRPYPNLPHGESGPVWNPFVEWGRTNVAGLDSTYVAGCLACASGGFSCGFANPAARQFQLMDVVSGNPIQSPPFIEQWDTDGIVNTASMLWPDDNETFLVQGDHADIIGHYRLDPSTDPNEARKHERYDIFVSNSGFDDVRFKAVWNRIFDFCIKEDAA